MKIEPTKLQPDEHELLIIELDERLEFSVVVDVSDIERNVNAISCANTACPPSEGTGCGNVQACC